MKTARHAGWGILALIAALLAVNAIRAGRGCSDLRPMRGGDAAPPFSLPMVTEAGELGDDLELSSLRGQVVVLDFWATWCGPCRESMPALETIARRHAESGLVLVSINTEGPEMASAARTMQRSLAPSSLLVSDRGVVSNLYRVTTIPHIVVIDRAGVVRWVKRGFSGASAAELEDELTALL